MKLVRLGSVEQEKVLMQSRTKKVGDCWEWQRSLMPNGYGNCQRNGEASAHRYMAKLYFGDTIKGKLVCHKCDNRRCINPDHFFIGTHKDNAIDCSKKGRSSFQIYPTKNAKKTHCKRGHEFTVENTRFYESTKSKISRICIICKRSNLNAWARAKVLMNVEGGVTMKIQTGDLVQYEAVIGSGKIVEGIVKRVLPDGSKGCKEPMVKIDTISGYILASHCKVLTMDVAFESKFLPKREENKE